MKTSIDFEQCSAGWKVVAHVEDIQSDSELNVAQCLVEKAAEFGAALPGWNLEKATGESDPEQNKWRKAYFARKQWAAGKTR